MFGDKEVNERLVRSKSRARAGNGSVRSDDSEILTAGPILTGDFLTRVAPKRKQCDAHEHQITLISMSLETPTWATADSPATVAAVEGTEP